MNKTLLQSFFLGTLIVCLLTSQDLHAQNLINNGNFSSGSSYWTTSGNWHAATAPLNCYNSASYYAYFSQNNYQGVNYGSGYLYQDVTLQPYTSSGTLVYYLSISTD